MTKIVTVRIPSARKAGEIVESTESGATLAGGARKGVAPRSNVRQEMGISKDESHSWQSLARVPKPVFDEYVDKVRAREAPAGGEDEPLSKEATLK